MYKTVEEVEKENSELMEKLNKALYKIGYNENGVFVLRFPNGQSYVGMSKKMGHRIRGIVRQLFKNNERGVESWISEVRSKNREMINFKDLIIIYYPVPPAENLISFKKEVIEKERKEGREVVNRG